MSFRKIILAIFLVLTIIITVSVFLADMIIPSLVFRPVSLPETHVYEFTKPHTSFYIYPDADIKTEVVLFKTTQPKGAILYFHGNKDNLARWGRIAEQLTEYGYDVFVLDYRGYGKSTGIPTEAGVLCDAEQLIAFIQQNYDYEKLIYYGRSLGTGIAAWLTSNYCPDGLILESPYYSLESLIRFYYPLYSTSEDGNISFPSWQYLKNHNTNVLIIHGSDDNVIPPEQALKLHEHIADQNTSIVIISGGTHENLSEFQEFHDALSNFLR